MKKYSHIFFLLSIVAIFFVSCERDDDERDDPTRYAIDTTRTYTDDTYENRLKDSVWYYYKYLSLWEKAISPTTSRIGVMDSVDYLKNNYTKYFQSAGDVLGYLMYTTKVSVVGNKVKPNIGSGNYFSYFSDILYTHQAGESKAYDWYSFLDRGGFVTGAIQQGYISGFGMDLMYLQKDANNLNSGLYIRFVEKNSAAYKAGLRRGQQIISLNGDTKIDYNSQKASNFRELNNYLNLANLAIEYKTPTGQEKTVSIAYARNSYADAVFADTVLVAGNKNVAYLGLSSFLSTDAWVLDKGVTKPFQSRLSEVFNSFSSKNVENIVVDLRYNGGGSVLTAEYLSDLLVRSSASGSLMYSYKINDILKQLGWDDEGEDFAPVKFNKKGNLNVSNIYFLVSEETASASELLINNLTPYMNVYMIGTYRSENNTTIAKNTYGKPVGFFPIDIVSISNELYVTSFQMFNKNGYGDYFDGLKPNTHVWEYDSFFDFGQQEESMLSAALNHIKSGNFKSTATRSVSPNTNFDRKFMEEGFKSNKIRGMYKFPTKKIHF
ncbi:S41 family peptidase [Sphingobacterium litopenaei]|uniref:Tail specific protease domain-containing protein n=1 Tax=Sphingobacterium litopenaei TaxID=2763500 RepID=A0ABR7YHQ9_9SPHI|nr:S41 family peptidase [Sphingobacterium litopenaei]MBD1430844.1 hypothetical protein [Sphingobacterium litopenaei]